MTEINHSLNRITAYIAAKKEVSGLHPEVIHVIHANGGKHELRVSDLEALLQRGEISVVDHRKIGCLIHDAIKTTLPKHMNVIRIYDAIKPYLLPENAPEPVSGEVVDRASVASLRNEVNCRIEHGANSNGHLEYVQKALDKILVEK